MSKKGKKKLTWHGPSKKWRKRYQGKDYYFDAGRGKSDRDAYRKAVTAWEKKQAELAKEQGDESVVEQVAQIIQNPDREKKINQRRIARLFQNPNWATEYQPIAILPTSKLETIEACRDEFIREKHAEADSGQVTVSRVFVLAANIQAFIEFSDSQEKYFIDEVGEKLLINYRNHVIHQTQGDEAIARDTAKARFQALKQFVRWAYTNRHLDELPRNLDDLTIRVIPKQSSEIKVYRLEDLRSLYAASNQRNRLYMLLALNCGFTQQDIATLTPVMVQDGWIDRLRSKTSQPSRHKLWNETLRLLREEGDFDADLLITDRAGRPLIKDRVVNGKQKKSDVIRQAWNRLSDRVGIAGTFKMLRKTSVTEVKKINNEHTSWFLAHSAQNVADKHYVKKDYDQIVPTLQALENVYDLPYTYESIREFCT